MRLDHLLSKEHLPPKGGKEPAPSECGGGVLNGGDTGESAAGNGHHGEYASTSVGGGKLVVVRLAGRRIAPCWVLKEQPLVGSSVPLIILVLLPLWGVGLGCGAPGMAWPHIPRGASLGVCRSGVGWWVVGWSFVENCTVDASIFVVKLSRANGGCLGTRSR